MRERSLKSADTKAAARGPTHSTARSTSSSCCNWPIAARPAKRESVGLGLTETRFFHGARSSASTFRRQHQLSTNRNTVPVPYSALKRRTKPPIESHKAALRLRTSLAPPSKGYKIKALHDESGTKQQASAERPTRTAIESISTRSDTGRVPKSGQQVRPTGRQAGWRHLARHFRLCHIRILQHDKKLCVVTE